MTTEPSGDSDESHSPILTGAYVGEVISETLTSVRRQLDSNARRIEYLVPYVAGMYYTDRQRQMAEAQLVSLLLEQERLTEQQHAATTMAIELYRPVYVTT